jgi:hypothetical protein
MNQIPLTKVGTYSMGPRQPVHSMLFTHVDNTLMKNIFLVLIGSLLFLLCYRVSRWQTAYVNASQDSLQMKQALPKDNIIAHTKSSFGVKIVRL